MAYYAQRIFKLSSQDLILRQIVFTWMYMILVILSLNLEGNLAEAAATKTIYFVSTNEVATYVVASKNCNLQGGHLIDLESPFTKNFLVQLNSRLDPKADNRNLYYTGLLYDTEHFFWVKERCSLTSREKLANYGYKNLGTVVEQQMTFQIRYVPGSIGTGTLGENFDGYWKKPKQGKQGLICQVNTTEVCIFVERTNVVVDISLELRWYFVLDVVALDTCTKYCLDEDCGIYIYDSTARVCTLWFVDRLSNPSDYLIDIPDGQLSVYYRDCVDIQFFHADNSPIADSYMPCQFEQATSTVSEEVTTDLHSEDTSTSGWDLTMLTTTIDDIVGTTLADVVKEHSTDGSTEAPINTDGNTFLDSTEGSYTLGMSIDDIVGTTFADVAKEHSTDGSTQAPINTDGNTFLDSTERSYTLGMSIDDIMWTTFADVAKEHSTDGSTQAPINTDGNTFLDSTEGSYTLGMSIDDIVGTTFADVAKEHSTDGSTQAPINTDGNTFLDSTEGSYTLGMSTEGSYPLSENDRTTSAGNVDTELKSSISQPTVNPAFVVMASEALLPTTPASSGKSLVVSRFIKHSTCQCACRKSNNDSVEEKAEFTREMLSNLTIDTKNTSANIRKYVSVQDDRPSAVRIGCFGGVILGVSLSIPVLLDIISLCVFLSKTRKKSKVKNNGEENQG